MSNATKDFPFVSVIIPVFNNSKLLSKCLKALENQSYPTQKIEIIVVDNASTEKISEVTNNFSRVTLAYEEKPGSYAARNTGIKLSNGTILAFTDSDCIPDIDWIEKGVKALIDFPNCGLVAGKIELFYLQPDRPNAIEFYDCIAYLNQQKYVKDGNFGATANMFTFAQRFQEVGLFNSSLNSGGDKEWGGRISLLGLEAIFAEDAVVKHPARSSVRQLQNKCLRVVGGLYYLDRIGSVDEQARPRNKELIQEVFHRLKPPVSYLRWRLSDSRLKGIGQKLTFIFITVYMDYSIAWEIIRLRLGGTAKRL